MRSVPTPVLVAYALPGLALSMPTIAAFVYLPTFYATHVGLGLAAVGGVLVLTRVLDVVSDPLVGWASDRFGWRRNGGHLYRKPYIIAGGLIAGPALLALFMPPEGAGLPWLGIWAALLYLGWTLISVPYSAWGAQLSDDYHERSRITAAREAAMIVGILLASAIPGGVAMLEGRSSADGLALVAVLTVVLGAAALGWLLRRVPEPSPRQQERTPPPGTLLSGLASLRANAPFMRLVAAWFINGLANGFPAVLFLLFANHVLGASETEAGLLVLLYFAAGVAAMPLWTVLSKRLGKHRTWNVAMVVACLAFMWAPLLGEGDLLAFAVICVITGMALGADMALPPAIQADVIDLDTLRHGKPRTALFFALWSMGTKLALACAVGIAFPVLEAVGFSSTGENDSHALLTLSLIYAAAPVVIKAVAILIMAGYPLSQRKQVQIQRLLMRRSERKGT